VWFLLLWSSCLEQLSVTIMHDQRQHFYTGFQRDGHHITGSQSKVLTLIMPRLSGVRLQAVITSIGTITLARVFKYFMKYCTLCSI